MRIADTLPPIMPNRGKVGPVPGAEANFASLLVLAGADPAAALTSDQNAQSFEAMGLVGARPFSAPASMSGSSASSPHTRDQAIQPVQVANGELCKAGASDPQLPGQIDAGAAADAVAAPLSKSRADDVHEPEAISELLTAVNDVLPSAADDAGSGDELWVATPGAGAAVPEATADAAGPRLCVHEQDGIAQIVAGDSSLSGQAGEQMVGAVQATLAEAGLSLGGLTINGQSLRSSRHQFRGMSYDR